MEKRFPTPALDNTHRHVYNYVYLYGCLGYAVQQLSDTKLRQYYFSCTSLYAMDQYSVCINNNRLIHGKDFILLCTAQYKLIKVFTFMLVTKFSHRLWACCSCTNCVLSHRCLTTLCLDFSILLATRIVI